MKLQKLFITFMLVFTLALLGCTQPPEDVESAIISDSSNEVTANFAGSDAQRVSINQDVSTFEFEGYGPGKSHIGFIRGFEGELLIENDEIVGAQGVLDLNTIDTGIGGLDAHLKRPDMFDVERCPEGQFSSTSIKDGIMTGDLTIHCITKSIQVPVNASGSVLESNFLLDITEFEMEHVALNQNVRIAFTMVGAQ